ncbi:MAG: Hint domain-containing protein [Rhodospirillales bacterium]|nr:Hint domain-containing protein [Rhodospirillales bacterium]
MASSYTAGRFTVSGFIGSDTHDGAFNANYGGNMFSAPSGNGTDGFDWDYTSSPAQVVTVTATGVDGWSLTMSLNALSGTTALLDDKLIDGSNYSASNGGSFTITGSGGAALQATIQNLQLVIPEANKSFGVTFSLTDTTLGATTEWTEYFHTPCYAAGTRIATPAGEVAVEALAIGDLVMTASGVARPVKWIGRRSYTAAQIAAFPAMRPVVVRRDAIGPAMPHRDLMVSPIHALFIDDVFIPAAALVNDVSILRHDELAAVSYIHVELAAHDVVFAEGMPAETFVDDDSRLMFDNSDEYVALYGAAPAAAGFAAPRLEEGTQLDAIRRRIAARAGLVGGAAAPGALRGHVERLTDGLLEGWVTDEASPGQPVEIEILVDGESVARLLANRYRVDLDQAGIAGGRCGFTIALPAAATEIGQITVRRTADGARLAMAQTATA